MHFNLFRAYPFLGNWIRKLKVAKHFVFFIIVQFCFVFLGAENAKNLKENGSSISAFGNDASMMSNLTMRQTIDFQDESEALLLQHHLHQQHQQQQQRGKTLD